MTPAYHPASFTTSPRADQQSSTLTPMKPRVVALVALAVMLTLGLILDPALTAFSVGLVGCAWLTVRARSTYYGRRF